MQQSQYKQMMDKVNADNTLCQDGELEISCSNCKKNLVMVKLTHPDIDIITNIYVECANCGDKAFPKKVKGKFYLGGTDDIHMLDTQYITMDNKEVNLYVQTIKVK